MRKGRISDLIGNNIFFRELRPQNPDLVPIDVVLYRLNLDRVPRKNDPEYPQVISCYLNLLGDFDRILFLGDTMLNDRTFALGLINLGEYDVFALITDEDEKEFELREEGRILYSNRWSFVTELKDYLEHKGFRIDEKTAVILDIDKTLIGARGRNHRAIDLARARAVYRLYQETGTDRSFDEFRKIYDRINSFRYHHITQDNQDLVALFSIAIASGQLKKLSGDPVSLISMLRNSQNEAVRMFAEEVYKNITRREATLFPTFRRMEYYSTIEFMDRFEDEPVEKLLGEEILITGEIYDAFRGTLSTVIALTDKPEISSLPPEGEDLPPVHEKTAKVYP